MLKRKRNLLDPNFKSLNVIGDLETYSFPYAIKEYKAQPFTDYVVFDEVDSSIETPKRNETKHDLATTNPSDIQTITLDPTESAKTEISLHVESTASEDNTTVLYTTLDEEPDVTKELPTNEISQEEPYTNPTLEEEENNQNANITPVAKELIQVCADFTVLPTRAPKQPYYVTTFALNSTWKAVNPVQKNTTIKMVPVPMNNESMWNNTDLQPAYEFEPCTTNYRQELTFIPHNQPFIFMQHVDGKKRLVNSCLPQKIASTQQKSEYSKARKEAKPKIEEFVNTATLQELASVVGSETALIIIETRPYSYTRFCKLMKGWSKELEKKFIEKKLFSL